MPIKINVPFSQKDEAKQKGAIWLNDAKTWVIPDNIENIDPFDRWLPGDGFILSVRAAVNAGNAKKKRHELHWPQELTTHAIWHRK